MDEKTNQDDGVAGYIENCYCESCVRYRENKLKKQLDEKNFNLCELLKELEQRISSLEERANSSVYFGSHSR